MCSKAKNTTDTRHPTINITYATTRDPGPTLTISSWPKHSGLEVCQKISSLFTIPVSLNFIILKNIKITAPMIYTPLYMILSSTHIPSCNHFLVGEFFPQTNGNFKRGIRLEFSEGTLL